MKPLGQELTQLAARRPIKEFKQRYLDHAAGSSPGMSTIQSSKQKEHWQKAGKK